VPKVYWSDGGEVVTIACDSSFFILKLNSALLSSAAEAGEDGIEVCFYTNRIDSISNLIISLKEAFELLHEVNEK